MHMAAHIIEPIDRTFAECNIIIVVSRVYRTIPSISQLLQYNTSPVM